MEERFSSYLSEIGLLNETDSSSIIKKDEKASNKSFADTSFECLKNYFDNLDEEQKKYMSLYIPSKYIQISDKIKKAKMKSVIIQLILRGKNILLKYFLIWKNNIILMDKLNNYHSLNRNVENENNIQNGIIYVMNENINQNENKNDINEKKNNYIYSEKNLFNNIANKYLNNQNNNKNWKENNTNNNIKVDEYKDNISTYNIVNIDGNVDVDNKNLTKSEEEEKSEINQINANNSISFGNTILKKNNSFNEKNKFKQKINPKNIIKIENMKNIKNIKNKNNEKVALKSYYYKAKNKNINQIKKQININSYKTISTNNNIGKQSIVSQYSTKNNNISRRNSTKNNLHTSLEEKELRELKECTFKPKINYPTNNRAKRTLSQNDINSSLILQSNYNNKNKQKREEEIQLIFEKLYKDNEKYKLSREMKVKEREKMISINTPFIPNAKKNLKKTSLRIKRYKSEGNFEKFEERQKEYMNKKNKHSMEIKNKIDSEFEELCSFNPKITNDKGEYFQITKKEKISSKPVHIRLYEDGKDRKNYQMKIESEKMNKILDLSNILNPQKNFNFETINRLHENKEQKMNFQKTKKKVEEDEGVTFNPFISESSYLKDVQGNFYERNKKWMNDRESYYEEEKKKNYEKFKNNNDKKKEYTKEERQKIINNIINRLYKESVQINKKQKNEENEHKEVIKEKVKNFKSYMEN